MESVDYYKQIYGVGTVVKLNPIIPDFLMAYFHEIDKAVVQEPICFFDDESIEVFTDDKLCYKEELPEDYTASKLSLFIVESLNSRYPFKGNTYYPNTLIFLEEDIDMYLEDCYMERDDCLYDNDDMGQEEYEKTIFRFDERAEKIVSLMGEPCYVLYEQTVSSEECVYQLPKLPTL